MSDDNERAQVHNTFLLGNRTYDFIKKLVQIVLPAFSAAYFGLAEIWNWGYTTQVCGTIAVVTTFLGVCLGISSAQYAASGKAFDGRLVIRDLEDGRKNFSLEVDGDPTKIPAKDSITFKVQNEATPFIEDPHISP